MEEWRDVVGYEGLYQVSNTGLVRTLLYVMVKKNGRKKTYKPRMVKLTHKDGYTMVRLFKHNGERIGRLYKVHRLVAMAFIPNPDNKPFIDHINTIRDDNRVENLRWCTVKENANNPISLRRNRESTRKRFENPEERKRLADIRAKWFAIDENRQKFIAIMSSPDVKKKRNDARKVKAIMHFDKTGVLIAEYKSSEEASKKLGIHKCRISNYCLGKTMPKDRSVLLYSEDVNPQSVSDRIANIQRIYSGVGVIQLTKDGDIVGIFSSIRDASESTGILESSISNVLGGRSRTSGGYIWKRKG